MSRQAINTGSSWIEMKTIDPEIAKGILKKMKKTERV